MGDLVAAVVVASAASPAEGSDVCCSPEPPSHRGSTGSPSPVAVKRVAEETKKRGTPKALAKAEVKPPPEHRHDRPVQSPIERDQSMSSGGDHFVHDVFYVPKSSLSRLQKAYSNPRLVTADMVRDMTRTDHLSDEEIMVPIDMTEISKYRGVEEMLSILGARLASRRFLTGCEKMQNSQTQGRQQISDMTLREWRQIQDALANTPSEEDDEGRDEQLHNEEDRDLGEDEDPRIEKEGWRALDGRAKDDELGSAKPPLGTSKTSRRRHVQFERAELPNPRDDRSDKGDDEQNSQRAREGKEARQSVTRALQNRKRSREQSPVQ